MLALFTNFFGSAAKSLAWFISAVVIPATVWFTVVKLDIENLRQDQAQTKIELNTLRTEGLQSETILKKQLEEINRSLGRIEGELRRIK